MRVIGDEPKVLIEIEESYAIALGFPTTDDTLKRGQFVKLNADGSVSKVAAATDRPLGFVTSSYQGTDKGNVRVVTPFNAVFRNAVADGVVDEGTELATRGNHTDGTVKFRAAVVGDFVVGIAITGGADLSAIQVGAVRVPYRKTA